MSKIVDYIIVGQGLAGTALSWQLFRTGASVVVINRMDQAAASMVAGGLYNPVTGHKMAKTWKADNLFHEILPFYASIEAEIARKVLHDIGIYRPFISIEESNDWQGRASSEEYSPYVKELQVKTVDIQGIDDPYGGILLAKAGYVDVAGLVEGFQRWLKKSGMYIEENFEASKLAVHAQSVSYGSLEASKVIFCQGVIGQNPYFDWLPFRPVKGELMEVACDTDFDFILNRGGFMVPMGGGSFRLGATYNWHLEGGFETKSEQELMDKIATVFKMQMKIKDRKWGIRPATKDRRPFIGMHPEYPSIGIFNGFGSKGVSLVPYFAKHFVDFLKNGHPIDPSVDINRYFSLT